MFAALLADGRLYDLLQRFDEDLAAEHRAGGCARCGSVLHSARYRRKPRGFAGLNAEQYGWRLALQRACIATLCVVIGEIQRRAEINRSRAAPAKRSSSEAGSSLGSTGGIRRPAAARQNAVAMSSSHHH